MEILQEVIVREPYVGFTFVNHWETNKGKPNQLALQFLIELCKSKDTDEKLILSLKFFN